MREVPAASAGRTPVFAKVYENKPPPLPEGYAGDPAIEVKLHELDLYVTMRCNIRCRFCNVRAGRVRPQVDPARRGSSRCSTRRPRSGLQEVHFLGGEPTLRPDLEDMIEHARGLGLHTRIISNGMSLSRARLERLIAKGLCEIMISVDGLEETHNRLRLAGPDGFATTMAHARGTRSTSACARASRRSPTSTTTTR